MISFDLNVVVRSAAIASAMAGIVVANAAHASSEPDPGPPHEADIHVFDGNDPSGKKNVFDGDYLVVAVGAGYTSDYEGSDDYEVFPGAALRGSYKGIGFSTQGIGLGLDLIPDEGKKIGFSLGPVVRYMPERSGSVKDRVVDMLPRLNKTVELGVGTGISFRKILLPQDALSFGADVRWDVSGNGAGRTIDTSVSYFAALSEGMGFGLTVGTDRVNDKYADYYYTVTPEDSAATGGELPVYQAKGGWKNRTARFYLGADLDGDFRNGGFGIGAAFGYSRLRGSAADTPIVSLRGDRDQYSLIGGIGYIF